MIASVLAALSLLAAAQTADEAERARQLEALARAMGEAHHLRRVCGDEAEPDLFRARMGRLIELERTASEETLIRAFNAGFNEARREHRECSRAARRARRANAEKGEALVIAVVGDLGQAPPNMLVAADDKVRAMLVAATRADGETGETEGHSAADPQ